MRYPSLRLGQYDPTIIRQYRKGKAVTDIGRFIGVPWWILSEHIERLAAAGRIIRRPRQQRRPWTRGQETLLLKLWNLGVPTDQLGRHFGKTANNLRVTIHKRRQDGIQFKRRRGGAKAAGTTMPLRAALAWLRSLDQPVRCARCDIRLDLARHPNPMVRVPVANQYHLCRWCTQDHLLSPTAAAAVFSESPIPARPPGQRQSDLCRPRHRGTYL